MAHILYIANEIRRRSERKNEWRYRLRDVSNPFELNDKAFVRRFRLSKEAVLRLVGEVKPYMKVGTNGCSVELQVLCALRIMGSGSFLNVVADGVIAQISTSSASRYLNRTVQALFSISKKYIKFPRTASEICETRLEFHRKYNFPNVIGAIDGSHVYICKPSADAKTYLNRKSRYSINVQMACDSNMKIIDVVARWPGSTHDAFIWNLSGARQLLSSGTLQQSVFLLGDKGYPLEKWLMTPYRDPSSTLETNFNKAHCSTRNIIERCFGVLKSRFRILDESGGILQYTPVKCCKIIIASAVLHNICILHNVEEPEISVQIDDSDDDVSGFPHDAAAEILRYDIAVRLQSGL